MTLSTRHSSTFGCHIVVHQKVGIEHKKPLLKCFHDPSLLGKSSCLQRSLQVEVEKVSHAQNRFGAITPKEMEKKKCTDLYSFIYACMQKKKSALPMSGDFTNNKIGIYACLSMVIAMKLCNNGSVVLCCKGKGP